MPRLANKSSSISNAKPLQGLHFAALSFFIFLAFLTASTPLRALEPPSSDPYKSIRFTSKGRVVAIGDLHGDLTATQAALRLAGATDSKGHWIAKGLTVIQTGDLVDRGPEDLEVFKYLKTLQAEATQHTSQLILLNGNHELMNMHWDFRYTHPTANRSFIEFMKPHRSEVHDSEVESYKNSTHKNFSPQQILSGLMDRALAYMPGAPLARQLADLPLYAIVEDSVFVHGGILEAHLNRGLSTLQDETQKWMKDQTQPYPKALDGPESPLWTRKYGTLPSDSDSQSSTLASQPICKELERVLNRMEVKRMVVGHTIQPDYKINSSCGGKVWRIDVAMTKAVWGEDEVHPPYQVLEISPKIQVLSQAR